jgi:hypothetical protein
MRRAKLVDVFINEVTHIGINQTDAENLYKMLPASAKSAPAVLSNAISNSRDKNERDANSWKYKTASASNWHRLSIFSYFNYFKHLTSLELLISKPP